MQQSGIMTGLNTMQLIKHDSDNKKTPTEICQTKTSCAVASLYHHSAGRLRESQLPNSSSQMTRKKPAAGLGEVHLRLPATKESSNLFLAEPGLIKAVAEGDQGGSEISKPYSPPPIEP